MSKVLFIVAHRPGRSPGQRFRFEQYLSYLKANGFECDISYIINEKDDKHFYAKGRYIQKFIILLKSILIRIKDVFRANQYDIIFIYREAVMFGSILFEKLFAKSKAKIILDFDDSIWLMDISDGNKNLQWLKKPSKTANIIKLSDLILVGNQYLANYALQFNNNVKIIPTTIDTEYYLPTSKITHNKICIGWTGSSTTIKHLEGAVPILKHIQEKYPNVYFKVISDVPLKDQNLNIHFCKWKKETEISDLSELDIGIMPLPDDLWAKGKCGFKGLQYMALEIPTIMSPIGVNTEIINHGINGFLANSEEEWIYHISLLIDNIDLRNKLGKQGRKTIIENFSYLSQKDIYLSCIKNILSK